jgi:hypothetical protein
MIPPCFTGNSARAAAIFSLVRHPFFEAAMETATGRRSLDSPTTFISRGCCSLVYIGVP